MLTELSFARHMAGADVDDLWTTSGLDVEPGRGARRSPPQPGRKRRPPDVLWATSGTGLNSCAAGIRRSRSSTGCRGLRAGAPCSPARRRRVGAGLRPQARTGTVRAGDLGGGYRRPARGAPGVRCRAAPRTAGAALVSELELDADPTVEVALSDSIGAAALHSGAVGPTTGSRREGRVRARRLLPPPQWMRALPAGTARHGGGSRPPMRGASCRRRHG